MAAPTKRAWKLQESVAHGSSVNCLALGQKSGRVMVTGGDDKRVNLWAIGNPNYIMSLTGHTTAVECVKFNHKENVVCAGSCSGAIKVWDLETAKLVRTIVGHKSNVRCLDFHPTDDDYIVSGSTDRNIKLWDVKRKDCIYTYKGHTKAVNSLKFSPDGKWIASGSEDGIIKLWDWQAGKLIAEFQGHLNSISGVEFHPFELLLASGSTDRTVKFWDLERFQLVSSTDGDCGPVRCIYFSRDGEYLFAGSQDTLKVYRWEPSYTQHTLVTGWDKVADMSTSQNNLIAGAFSLMTVSVHVVELEAIHPFSESHNQEDLDYIPHLQNTSESVEVKRDEEEADTIDDIENDNLSLADLGEQDGDYKDVFIPRSELCRTPPKTIPFPAPLDDSKTEHSDSKEFIINTPETELKDFPETDRSLSPFKPQVEKPAPYLSRLANISSSPEKSLTSTPYVNRIADRNTPPFVAPSPIIPPSFNSTYTISVPSSSVMHIEKTTATTWQRSHSSETVSVVRPVPAIPERDTCKPQKAVILPEQLKSSSTTKNFVPEQRERPAGLDVDEFLPRHLHDSLQIGIPSQPEMSEAEAMSSIFRGHESMMAVFSHRKKKLQIILAQWKSKETKMAIESAVHMSDQAVLVDILNIITLRQTLWSLDLCQLLLPSIYELLQSKFETYMQTGCVALRLILKNFMPVIKNNMSAPTGIGVDISREERYNKCRSCYKYLLSIRSFLLKRQTLQGKLGQSFRELQILMQSLE